MGIGGRSEVRFLTPEENGRQTDVEGNFYSCPLFFQLDKTGFDCRLILSGRKIKLGEKCLADVKFLNRSNANNFIRKDASISLWEGRFVAEGKIVEVYPDSAESMSK